MSLSQEIVDEIFGYLTMGDVFYSFYRINQVMNRKLF